MSRTIRKPALGICESKNTDQLRGNRTVISAFSLLKVHSQTPNATRTRLDLIEVSYIGQQNEKY